LKWASLTVLTASIWADEALVETGVSLEKLACDPDSPAIRWIVVAGVEALSACRDYAHRLPHIDSHVVAQSPRGIYPAINAALDLCVDSPFVILGAGDQLSPTALSALSHVQPDQVTSGLTSWHAPGGSSTQSRRSGRSRSYPALGLFRSHQGMIFGPRLAHERYAEEYPIAADLDVKLRLWRKGSVREINVPVASCLVGGASDRRPTSREIGTRSQELRQVFLRHFSRPHAEAITMLHRARLVQRSLGLRPLPSERRIARKGSH